MVRRHWLLDLERLGGVIVISLQRVYAHKLVRIIQQVVVAQVGHLTVANVYGGQVQVSL